jgi:23S rRNA maturation mini-RNase III
MIDNFAAGRNSMDMSIETIKTELRDIADHIPESASYGDAMYELYVRMKIAKGRQAAEEKRTISHEDVKRKFLG